MKNLIKLASISVAALLLTFSAHAATITFGDYGIGSWTPGNEFNGDNVVGEGVNHSVAIWNGTATAGLYTFVAPGNDPSATFTKGMGSLVPVTLPTPASYIGRVENVNFANWAGLDNSAGKYTYITAKYGNLTQQVFYIGGLFSSDIKVALSLPGLNGSGLSHVAYLSTEGTDIPRVPEGGATAALLGLSLVGLHIAFRRRS